MLRFCELHIREPVIDELGFAECGVGLSPGSSRWSAMALAALALAAAPPGCYKPSIVDGKLICGPADACPDGYACVERRCWQGGNMLPNDAGDLDGANESIDGPAADLACLMPIDGCISASPSTGACDPVCQQGCGCHEKCTASGTGELACVTSQGQQAPGQSCNIDNYGTPDQSDNCAPAAVCLRPGGAGSTQKYCFALCSGDGDCPGARCVLRPVAPPSGGTTPMAHVCDVPFADCDPFVPNNNGCPPDRPYCYLGTPDPATGASRTVCEYSTGGGLSADSCSYSRDCFNHLVCPRNDDNSGRRGAGFCWQPCDAGHPCGTGTCEPYGSTYGYCVIN